MCLPQWQQDPAIRCSELSQCRSARPSLPHPPSAAAFRQRPPRPGPRGPAPHPRVQRASACTVPETRSRLPAPAPPHSPRLVPLAALPFLCAPLRVPRSLKGNSYRRPRVPRRVPGAQGGRGLQGPPLPGDCLRVLIKHLFDLHPCSSDVCYQHQAQVLRLGLHFRPYT
ncbi:unnamed protein product [Rangifer tarandus platyrhynchus]|uniref:Uncharacterized protein n=1 Tax=Rangifer tarandus platyrhynchus TaxID=3082113 RepID=A0ABN8YGS7_RANTA|nr:unnamed protein product [Rangifer tarandus platyrhynchus]